MICPAPRPKSATPAWHAQFLAMLPVIRTQARFAFRHLDPEACQDAIEEAVANALVAFVRLVERHKTAVAYPSALVRFAVAQIKDGRRVGSRLNVHDVLSPYAQKEKGIHVESLDHYDAEEDEWIQAVVEDTHTPVPDQVAFRCDFPAWLATLSRRDRRIAETLAMGHTTGDVARRFRLSPGRISQLRQALRLSWQEFHGETSDGSQTVIGPE